MLKSHGFVVSIPHVRDCFRFFEKNFLRIFFNHAEGVTESASWRTPYVTTGNNLKLQANYSETQAGPVFKAITVISQLDAYARKREYP